MLTPGGNGMIDWKFDDDWNLLLEWEQPYIYAIDEAKAGDKRRYQWVQTFVVCSDSMEYAQMDCKCGYT